MGKIKSAWEIALEKTEGIQMDKEKIRRKSDIENIRKTAGAYLAEDDPDTAKLREDLSKYDRSTLADALMMTVTANISLPADENADSSRMERVKQLLSIASGGDPRAMGLMDEIIAFTGQYPKHRKDLMEKMKAQYQPVLDEKSAKLSRQYGTEVHLSFENDKEFLEAARKNLERLEAQYESTLQDAKNQLRAIISGEEKS